MHSPKPLHVPPSHGAPLFAVMNWQVPFAAQSPAVYVKHSAGVHCVSVPEAQPPSAAQRSPTVH